MFGFGKKNENSEAISSAPAGNTLELHPAGFWLRLVALIVDYALLLVLLGGMLMGAESVGGAELIVPAYWLWVLVCFLYWPVLESTSLRATLGKSLLGLVVADVDGGGISIGRSLLRNLAKIISAIPFGIGFLLAAFTSRKQALHDLITKAVVMRRGASSFVRAVGVLVVGLALLMAGSYLATDYLMGPVMKEMLALMGDEAPMPVKPAAVAKPVPKPAPPPVAAPAAPPAPLASAEVAAAKPAPVPVAPAPAPAATPAPVPAPVAATAPAAVAKPAAAAVPVAKPAAAPAATPVPKPAPPTVMATAKPQATEAPKDPPPAPVGAARPRVEPLPPLPGQGAQPAQFQLSPRFNDVMTAVLYQDRQTVSLLLDLGRWPDKRDSNGLTPLMVAALRGDAAMARLLLERGADPKLQAPGGLTALDFALESGDAAATQLLQGGGAR